MANVDDMREIGTGFDGIDAALGGLVSGDNVVWLGDDEELYRRLVAGLVRAAGSNGLLVDFGGRPTGDADVAVIDAGPTSPFRTAVPLADELERRVRADPPGYLVVDGLGRVVRRWGIEAVSAFFARVCPAMLDAGVTAYWSIDSMLGRSFTDHVRQITQCLLDVRGGRLRVLKAEGRADALQDITYQLQISDDDLVVDSPPAGGRLARGLSAVRQQFGLTQQELATVAGVTPSAISQAESGVRGLSLDTVIAIADRLEITTDRILSAGTTRSYTLARHDRSRQLANRSVTALASDSTIGLRAYLIDLAPGEESAPPFDHRGVAMVAPLRGLVQVVLDDDRPVLRPGDVLTVERGGVRAWRNLRTSPARCHWVLRD